MSKRTSIVVSVVCLVSWAVVSSPFVAAQSPELETPDVFAAENLDPIARQPVEIEPESRPQASSESTAHNLSRLFRRFSELSPEDRDKHRALLVELKQLRHELALRAAKIRQDLRDAESRIASAEAEKASAESDEEVAKRNLDEATLQAAAAAFAKKQAEEAIKAAQTVQKNTEQEQADAKEEQKTAEKNASAAAKLKQEAASEEEAARKLKEEWLRKEAAARAAKEAAAEVEAESAAARENAAQIEAAARAAHAAAVAKEAQAKLAQENAAKAETAAEGAQQAAATRETIVTGLKQEAAAREEAAKQGVATAVKGVETAEMDRDKLVETSTSLDEQHAELIARTRNLLVEAGLEQPVEEAPEVAEEPPLETIEEEIEIAQPVQPAPTSSNTHYRGRRFFFFRGR